MEEKRKKLTIVKISGGYEASLAVGDDDAIVMIYDIDDVVIRSIFDDRIMFEG